MDDPAKTVANIEKLPGYMHGEGVVTFYLPPEKQGGDIRQRQQVSNMFLFPFLSPDGTTHIQFNIPGISFEFSLNDIQVAMFVHGVENPGTLGDIEYKAIER